jgi:hypothetical protein
MATSRLGASPAPDYRVLATARPQPEEAHMQRPFNFQRWIDTQQDLLKPPVGNKSLFEGAA